MFDGFKKYLKLWRLEHQGTVLIYLNKENLNVKTQILLDRRLLDTVHFEDLL